MLFKSMLASSCLGLSLVIGVAACGGADEKPPSPSPEVPPPSLPQLNLVGQYVSVTEDSSAILVRHTRAGVLFLQLTTANNEVYFGAIHRQIVAKNVVENIRLFDEDGQVAGMARLNIASLEPKHFFSSEYQLTIELGSGSEMLFTGQLIKAPAMGKREIKLDAIKKDYLDLYAGHSYRWINDNTLSFTSSEGCELEGIVSQSGFKIVEDDLMDYYNSQHHGVYNGKTIAAGFMFDFSITKSSCDYDANSNAGLINFIEYHIDEDTVDMIMITVPSRYYLNRYVGISYQ